MLAHARQRLDALDARVLLGELLVRNPAWLAAHDDAVLTPEQALTYDAWVSRRAAGEPVAYIVGVREFYGREFRVTPDVLIPRPETELLVEQALTYAAARCGLRVLDLGTGSGCIAITLALELAGAQVVAVDRSAAALAVARDNATRLGAAVDCRVSDWYGALGPEERYDVIVANPPYIAGTDRHLGEGDLRFEPRGALTPEGDGLDALRLIIGSAPRHLVVGGLFAVEHGYDQAAACRELFAAAGYADIASRRDLAGIERVTLGRRAPGG